MQIKNRFDGRIIFEDEGKTIKETVRNAIKSYSNLSGSNLSYSNLRGSDLRGSNLRGSDLRSSNLSYSNLSYSDLRGSDLRGSDLSGSNLSYSDLRGSDLSGSNLSYSNLSYSDLSGSNLSGSNLRGSNLRGSNLSYSNLSYSNLRGSDLRGSDLRGSNLRGSNLSSAKIEFALFPSIRLLSSMPLYNLPDDLQLELMRRDALAHPHPELFDKWAKGGSCPYQNEERFWDFEEKRELWSPGLPIMADRDLIVEIVKSQGWTIKLKTAPHDSLSQARNPACSIPYLTSKPLI